MKILILTALTIATSMAADTSAAWNYIRSDTDVGPTAWDTNFATCAGERNSPINIKTGAAVQKAAVAWDLTGWNTNHTYTISDSHNGIKYTLDSANPITTQGGDLQNTYKLLQFHFHWGADDTKGSEHTVDGNEYPMEVHFVHWNGDYSDAGAAIASDDDDALAVLGFFFEIQDEDNEKLAGMIEDIQNVRANNYTLSDVFIENLSDSVYQSMTGNFYRYFGGLTTPGCNEIVRWTVFETPIGISAAQMATIRTQPQSYLDEYGEDFFRDPVALGSRTVVKYDVNYNSAAISCLSLSLAFLSAMVKFL